MDSFRFVIRELVRSILTSMVVATVEDLILRALCATPVALSFLIRKLRCVIL